MNRMMMNSSGNSELLKAHIERQMAKITQEAKENDLFFRRKKCFPDESFFTMTFENNADHRTPAFSSAKKYADDFKVFQKTNTGLIMFGPFGTGKTYLAACVANALIDKGYTCKLITLEDAVHELMDSDEKSYYLSLIVDVDLLILDDLGAEFQSDFMRAKVFEIINKRYIKRAPLIVTTNMTKNKILQPKEDLRRVMSRLWEMCLPINVDGDDKRRLALSKKTDTYAEIYAAANEKPNEKMAATAKAPGATDKASKSSLKNDQSKD